MAKLSWMADDDVERRNDENRRMRRRGVPMFVYVTTCDDGEWSVTEEGIYNEILRETECGMVFTLEVT